MFMSGGAINSGMAILLFMLRVIGRSLQGGGHKYKVKAYCDGKPVSTKELRAL
jgi:hypothetical protein